MPQLKPTRGICLNRSHPLSRGLVGLWLFNEGSGGQVFDLSGNNNTGSLVADTYFGPGKFGSALDFDGNGDYVDVKNFTNFNGKSAITVNVWVNIGSITDANGRLLDHRDGSNGFIFFINNPSTVPNGSLNFMVDTVTGTHRQEYISAPPTGVWLMLTGVYDKNASDLMKIYQNGVEQTTNLVNAGTGNIVDDSTDLSIGSNHGSNSRDFAGKIDHATIYNRALSASEIALLYREPFCMFEEAIRPKLIGGQIVNLAGNSVALSSLSATAKAMRKVGGNVVSTSDVAAILNLIRSLLYIESNWKREALFNGMTANAFKLGTTLSLGWFWVRVAGCSVLYRGSSMGEIDFVNILAVAEQNAREISPPSYISHNSGSTYFYVVRRFNNCGYQERTLAASVKVSIESNGELAEPQPNKVFDSGAELVDGNKILLVWYYCPLEQKSQPMCFNVYYDGRTGQINYENPLAIIGYKGRKFYRYQCGALEAGRYLFAIRTEDASGIENSSLARLRIQFDPTNPAAIDILSVEGV